MSPEEATSCMLCYEVDEFGSMLPIEFTSRDGRRSTRVVICLRCAGAIAHSLELIDDIQRGKVHVDYPVDPSVAESAPNRARTSDPGDAELADDTGSVEQAAHVDRARREPALVDRDDESADSEERSSSSGVELDDPEGDEQHELDAEERGLCPTCGSPVLDDGHCLFSH